PIGGADQGRRNETGPREPARQRDRRSDSRTSADLGPLTLPRVANEPDAAELPARLRTEEVAIGLSEVRTRSRAGSAAQHELVAHELAVVLAERAGGTRVAGIGRVRARRPLPDFAEHLQEAVGR